MRRRDRHARSSLFMMAISAVDNALWDIRGKHFGVPVYRLLGGPTRDRVGAYASMLGYSVEPDKAGKIAREYFDRGFTAQKWFFKYNPTHGGEGRKKNLQLVQALRKALGDNAELMFDCLWSWDVPYAISMAREILPYRPTWLEEPLHPEQLEGYKRIKRDTGIPLAAGEHFYTRWNVKQFLDAGVLDFVQADPEWCGGITELVKICSLAEAYEVKVVPHGHHILAAAHVVAAQPPDVCPMVEYLFKSHLDRMQYFHKRVLRPEKGWLQLPTQPGLDLELDEDKIAEKREMKWD
jgi:L-alanine-DL-glutamate epimerase-like enolase superfamily enzyme